LNYTRCG